MAKTKRKIQESLRLVDAVCEIVDARIPISSRNPDLDALTAGKPRIVVLNRIDQADPEQNSKWLAYFNKCGFCSIGTDSKSGAGIKKFPQAVRVLLTDKLDAYEKKGQAGHTVRVMVAGVPNVGKSSFINRLTGRSAAKAEDRPGVTRGGQWITVDGTLELLDTPGLLWPKLEGRHTGENLAFTGAVRDEILDLEELAQRLLCVLAKKYPDALKERYRIELVQGGGHEMLENAARKRGFLLKGGQADTGRMAVILLDEFRSGKLGRITLESPPESEG